MIDKRLADKFRKPRKKPRQTTLKASHEWKLKEPQRRWRRTDMQKWQRRPEEGKKNACGRQPQNVILFTRRPGETLRGECYVFIIFVSVASVVCQVATKRGRRYKKKRAIRKFYIKYYSREDCQINQFIINKYIIFYKQNYYFWQCILAATALFPLSLLLLLPLPLAVLILTAADGTKHTHLKQPNGCSLPLMWNREECPFKWQWDSGTERSEAGTACGWLVLHFIWRQVSVTVISATSVNAAMPDLIFHPSPVPQKLCNRYFMAVTRAAHNVAYERFFGMCNLTDYTWVDEWKINKFVVCCTQIKPQSYEWKSPDSNLAESQLVDINS